MLMVKIPQFRTILYLCSLILNYSKFLPDDCCTLLKIDAQKKYIGKRPNVIELKD